MSTVENIKNAFLDAQKALETFNADEENFRELEDLADKIVDAFKNKGRVLVCGNGGSHCDAMHFAEEFTGRYRGNREALPALALGSAPHTTCVANDFGFDYVFSREVEAFGQNGDVLIGLSTSGNSANIIEAIKSAKERGLSTALFLGKTGGKLKGQADHEWVVPGSTSDRIQEIHMAALHILIEAVERKLFPEQYQ